MKRIKVAVVDDHKIIRDGIVALFKNDEELDVCGQFESGQELLDALKTESFDVVLLDMHMPEMNGIETARLLLKQAPDIKILINTMSEEVGEIEQIVRLGAHGYILKSAGQEELAAAIKIIASGSSFFSPKVTKQFIKACISELANPFDKLSRFEHTVLAYLCAEDMSYEEVQTKMNIGPDELQTTISNIKQTLKLKTEFAIGKFCARYCGELKEHLAKVTAEVH